MITEVKTEKQCTKCGMLKPLDGFAKDKYKSDGLTTSCKTCRTTASKNWNLNHPERVRENDRRRNTTDRRRENQRLNQRIRAKKDNKMFKFFYNLRRKSGHIIRRQTGERGEVLRYIGCTRAQWIAHLEKLFKPGMTWGNYGKVWEVDHKIPVSIVDKTDREALIKLFHYTNTQPLFKDENRIKSNAFDNPGKRKRENETKDGKT